MADIAKKHVLNLEDRENLTVSGVRDLVGFDEKLVIFSLGESTLTVSGSGLGVTHLALETGDAVVKGRIDCIAYVEEKQKKGVLSRFLK